MSLEKSLKDTIKEKELKIESGLGLGKILQGASPFLAFVNLPIAIAAGAAGLTADTITKNRNLKSTMMPDEWLDQVAKSPYVSQEGLAFLMSKMGEGNTVSVADALSFLEIEDAHEKSLHQSQKPRLENKTETAKKFAGAEALKKRAGKISEDVVFNEPPVFNKVVKTAVAVVPKAVGLLFEIKGKKKLK